MAGNTRVKISLPITVIKIISPSSTDVTIITINSVTSSSPFVSVLFDIGVLLKLNVPLNESFRKLFMSELRYESGLPLSINIFR